ncbi:helix-turn-helix domain-containing protein [Streptomyces sp. NBC_00893]|uniref:helix-turn-helix domain-containing protein n=1 Tax=Streptomyces sp. NBC_00893 TaxID=2975862 RepID=UPI002250CF7D|nr:helix-turn-helix domain-containing protein [Streptomyces sp. NBC_00893]MCX4850929.1 helix-turn-helix domain-containing protein [Streptomyces sp. NBC_00893]
MTLWTRRSAHICKPEQLPPPLPEGMQQVRWVIAVDGEVVRGSRTKTATAMQLLVAMDHHSVVLAQRQVASKATRSPPSHLCWLPESEIRRELSMSRPGAKIPPLLVTEARRAVLEGWLRRCTTAQALAQRSRIVLECAEGHSITEVSRQVRIAPDAVRTWGRRFLERGLDGLCGGPRPGAPPPRKITNADVERVIARTPEETPKNATHWPTRSMAAATGMSQSTVSRIWRAFALAPHRSQMFKLSTDPLFIDKVRDAVGLYLDPPEKALVLCVDESGRTGAR